MKLILPEQYRVIVRDTRVSQKQNEFDCFARDAHEAQQLALERHPGYEVLSATQLVHGDYDAARPLRKWLLRYGEHALQFECDAQDIAHAVEQCRDAYPLDVVVSATLAEAANPPFTHWSAETYTRVSGLEAHQNQQFVLNIQDQRVANGQVYLDFDRLQKTLPDGENDRLTIMLEVNDFDQAKTPTQCVHVHFQDGDSLAFSIFKNDQGLVLRPETCVELKAIQLHNGDHAYLVN